MFHFMEIVFESPVLPITVVFGTGLIIVLQLINHARHDRQMKHIERMEMIEKGINPQEPQQKKALDVLVPRAVRIGCTAMGIGIGILFGGFLDDMLLDGPPAFFGSILLFGAGGLLTPYFLTAYFKQNGKK